MPIGIITDLLAVAMGGILGNLFGKRLPENIKQSLNSICCFAAIAIGITLIIKVHALAAVVLSLFLGSIIGEICHLETLVNNGIRKACKLLPGSQEADSEYLSSFSAVVVLFCAAGMGIFGALNEGFTGDSNLLFTKAILDFFTAVIFGAVFGKLVSFIALP